MESVATRASATVITGLSGSGKSTALKALEDLGYYCIDNLPAFLLPELLRGVESRAPQYGRLALVMDARDALFLSSHQEIFARLAENGYTIAILFLEAREELLVRRYSEMRRRHPLAGAGTVRDGIAREREELAAIRRLAHQIVDTSELTPHELRRQVGERYSREHEGHRLHLNLLSFGFKHGPPAEAEILFDVRFLPNPYFVPSLKSGNGLKAEVANYVLENETCREFLAHLLPLLFFLLPQYQKEGKNYLTIGIGCTGGQHRSVAIAEALKERLAGAGNSVSVRHRDMAGGERRQG